MVTLEAVLAGARRGASGLLPPDAALAGLAASMGRPRSRWRRCAMGRRSGAHATPRLPERPRVRLYGPEGVFLGLAEALPDGRLQPRRLILADAT